jgi:hypothetical protein
MLSHITWLTPRFGAAPESIGTVQIQDQQYNVDVQADAMKFMISICGEPAGLITGDQGPLDTHAALCDIQDTLRVDTEDDLDRRSLT